MAGLSHHPGFNLHISSQRSALWHCLPQHRALGLSHLFVSSLSASLHENVHSLRMGPMFNFLFPTCKPQYIFPCGSAGKESSCSAGNLGLIPGLGRSSGEGNSYPLQDSGLENSMDCTVYGVAKSQTRLSDSHFTVSLRAWHRGGGCEYWLNKWKQKTFLQYCLEVHPLSSLVWWPPLAPSI